MELKLGEKVAMVAGASRGLGFAIAKVLVAEGARVSIASRDAASIESAVKQFQNISGGTAWGMAADLRSPSDIAEWHAATVRQFGPVELLVANTGGPPAGGWMSFDDAAWLKAVELLLLSVVRLARAVVPAMAARKAGSILILSSSSVKEPIPNLALSNVIRPSVAAFAKSLAIDLAPGGVRVNHLIPGRIATDRVRELDEINSKWEGIPVEEQRKRMEARIPFGRYGEADELARAAAFLLSDAASYITGATLQVDGGMIRSIF